MLGKSEDFGTAVLERRASMRLCDLDEIKICVDRQYENCHGYSGSKKAIYREAILAVKSILHSAKSINGVTVQEWIPVKDRLPEDDSDVLAYSRIGEEFRIYPACYSNGVWFDCVFNAPATDTTTHWMPMPAPPKGE